MTFVSKNFDPSDGLLVGIPKMKPALYSDEDIKLQREILDNTIKEIHKKLGLVIVDGRPWLNHTTLSALYSGTTLTINIDLASGVLGYYRGVLLELPSNSGALPTISLTAPVSPNIASYGVWVTCTIQQLISSLKNDPSFMLYDSAVPTSIDDIIASITDVTVSGNILNEGFDFVSITNPSIDVIQDTDTFEEIVAGTIRLFRIATVTLDSSGTPNIYSNVDSASIADLSPFLAPDRSHSIDAVTKALYEFLNDKITTQLSLLNSSIQTQFGNYALLAGRNNFTARNTFDRAVATNRNITTNPISVIGSGSSIVGIIADVDSSTLVSGQAFYNHFLYETNGTAAIFANSNWTRVKIPSTWNSETSNAAIDIRKIVLSGNINNSDRASISVIEIDFEHLSPNSLNKITVNGIDITSKDNYGTIPFITDRTGADKKIYLFGVFETNDRFNIISSNSVDSESIRKTLTNSYTVSGLSNIILTNGAGITTPSSPLNIGTYKDSYGRVFFKGEIVFTTSFFSTYLVNNTSLLVPIGNLSSSSHFPKTVMRFIVSSNSSGASPSAVEIVIGTSGSVSINRAIVSSSTIPISVNNLNRIFLDTISYFTGA